MELPSTIKGNTMAKITYRGQTKLLSEWADEIGISRAAMSSRINEFEFTNRAEFLANMTTAEKKHLFRPKSSGEVKKFAGKTPAEWAKIKGVSRQAIHQRLNKVGTRYKSVQEAMDF